MSRLLLIVTIASQRVALCASEVQSVVELDTLTPVPRTPWHVAGLSALRSRVLTVIDCLRSLEVTHDRGAKPMREAAVVEHEGHFYALLVEGVEDVTEARSDLIPMRANFGHGWERVSRGMIETDEGPLLLIDVAAMIAGPEEARAA